MEYGLPVSHTGGSVALRAMDLHRQGLKTAKIASQLLVDTEDRSALEDARNQMILALRQDSANFDATAALSALNTALATLGLRAQTFGAGPTGAALTPSGRRRARAAKKAG